MKKRETVTVEIIQTIGSKCDREKEIVLRGNS